MPRPMGVPGLYGTKVKFYRLGGRAQTDSGESTATHTFAFQVWAQCDDLGAGTIPDADGKDRSTLYRIQYRKTAYLHQAWNQPQIGWIVSIYGLKCRVESVTQQNDLREVEVTVRTMS